MKRTAVNTKTMVLQETDLGRGHLILVNARHPVTGATGKLTRLSEGVFLEERTAAMLRQALADIRAGGQICAASGWRAHAEQEALYAASLRENGADFTRQFVALPGCSEHETGLAVDLAENRPEIDWIRPAFPETGICGRFREIAGRYGFIQRYQQGKEAITEISCEPWHFRYVGYPHSAIMEREALALEEYVDFLRAFSLARPLVWEAGGRRIEIAFQRAEGAATAVAVPADVPVQVSGNNVDGFILTIWRAA